MNTHELPMILFTVLSQMCVGAFVALGVVQLLAMGRYPARVIDRLADPALLAIGPTLVAGLVASTFHMHDITNTLNVIRHWDSSWLSREILAGVAFAGLGFLFFFMQWRKIGSPGVRQALAALTALAGLVLVLCQSMIYYTLVTVPAWNNWATPLRFYATAVLLGSLAVGVAMAASLARHTPDATDDAPGGIVGTSESADGGGSSLAGSLATLTRPVALTSSEHDQAERLLRLSLRTIATITMVTALVLVVAVPMYLTDLTADPTTASGVSGEVFSESFFVARMIMLITGAVILAFVVFRLTATKATTHLLTVLVTASLIICFIAEIMGRSVFYDSMARVGM